ncbi:MAG: hypothetical protein B7Z73_16360 [Planctomycetia bacterium 21-64-5]|nr:MAG: hypothetical protein B7Z73_16360 [Planctomycetia bacterium 21-64-5]
MTSKRRPYVEGDEPVPGYRLTAYLGEGGFGAVWRATAPGGAPAALKIVDLGTRQGQKEFRALAVIKRLQHPNLVPISAYWLKDADGQFLDPADMEQVAMQGVQSTVGNSTQQTIAVPRFRPPLELFIAMGLGQKSLGQRLAECREQGLDGIPPAELLRYMDDVASALDHLGNPSGQIGAALDGVQHGDIKPQNILIVSGRAQVCDFGLARVLTDTRRTSLSGSPAYMAPETQKNVLSPAVDQYSLAITYFELRTGRLPFADDLSLLEMWNVHLNGTLDLSALAPAEREVIARATALDPAMRFATSGEMVDALRKAVAGESAPAPQSVVVPVPHTPSKLRPVLMLAAMFGFAAVAVMGWFHSSSQLAPIRPVHGLALHVKPVVLKAGENGLAQVQVRRGDCNGPIRLTWRDLPEGVVPQGELVVPAADVAADITLSVDAKVPETTTKVYMSATAPGVDLCRHDRVCCARRGGAVSFDRTPGGRRPLALLHHAGQTGQRSLRRLCRTNARRDRDLETEPAGKRQETGRRSEAAGDERHLGRGPRLCRLAGRTVAYPRPMGQSGRPA